MKINRILAAILATVILLTLAGCGTSTQEQAPVPDGTTQSVSASLPTVTDSTSDTEHTDEKNSTTEQTSAAVTDETTEPYESETEPEATQPAVTTKPQTEKPAEETTAPETTEPTQTTEKEETKPVTTEPPTTTAPPEATNPSTEEPKETEPAETEPTESTEPAVTTPARPTASEIEPLVAQYLNEHRAAQGADSMTVLPGLTEVARFRAEQLITNFSHYSDPDACTVLKYGEFIDMTELGLDASQSYYQGYDAEACAKGNWSGSAEDIARRIADGFRNSSGHWRYLGSSEYTYMAVGLTYDTHTAKWYCCVCVSSKNYGG